MKPRTLSLRARLVSMMAVLFLGGTFALYLAARSYAQTAADRSFDRLLAGSALSIAETLSISGADVQADIPYAALDMLSAAPDDRVFYRVFGPGKRDITGYPDLPVMRSASASRGTTNSPPDEVRYFDADYRGERVRFALLGREVAEPGVNGWIWIQVGQTRRAREVLADELVLGALVPIALMTVLALGFIWVAVARALRPLEKIGHDLSGREPSDLQPLSTRVPHEIAPLVESLNGFMHRLGGNMSTLRAFIAEAAHQMRTPLAALRAQAQFALSEEDPEDLRRGLRAIERNAAKLSRLLNQLLSDASVLHRSDMRRFESFDLLQVVRKAVREAVPMIDEADVRLSTTLEEAPYTGDAFMLCEALKNLIDNAVRYGGDQPVLVSVDGEHDHYLVSVCDRGPGIAAEDRERVFERFTRGESAAPGVGLGLSIVRRAVQSQFGEIDLSDSEGGGLTVRLRLPRGEA